MLTLAVIPPAGPETTLLGVLGPAAVLWIVALVAPLLLICGAIVLEDRARARRHARGKQDRRWSWGPASAGAAPGTR